VSGASAQVTLTRFGSQPSAVFAAGVDAATASGLVVFGKPDHTCTLQCVSASRFTLTCINVASGAQCTESFRK
jgi:hypothetical protein